MKCFSIDETGEVLPGLPEAVPRDPKVPVKKGLVPNAEFLLEAAPDDVDDFAELQREDLSAASELALFELIKPAPKSKKQGYVLIGYSMFSYRLSKEHGDESHVVYRGTDGYVVIRAPKNACYICPRKKEGSPDVYYTVKKGVLAPVKITPATREKLRRAKINRRRAEHTVVYEY